MKKVLFCMAAVAVLLSGCVNDNDGKRHKKKHDTEASKEEFEQLKIANKSGALYYKFEVEEPMFGEGSTMMYGSRKYDIVWPENGSRDLQERLTELAFGRKSIDPDTEGRRFLKDIVWNDGSTYFKEIQEAEMPKNLEYGEDDFDHVNIKFTQDSNLYIFEMEESMYPYGAAHGAYASVFVVYDAGEKRVVKLSDLIDTNGLGTTIKSALTDLVVNKGAKESVYSEVLHQRSIEVTENFYIGNDRSNITLRYLEYEIAPYCEGPTDVVMPIYWLSKHNQLTEYGKRVFGEGSYLKE